MSEVMEQVGTEVTAKVRKQAAPLTAEQKQAATLRREAAMLSKHGATAKAAELVAKADALAPVRAQVSRVDPLVALSQEEQSWLINHFKTTKQGFAKIAALVSAKRLAEIFQSQGN